MLSSLNVDKHRINYIHACDLPGGGFLVGKRALLIRGNYSIRFNLLSSGKPGKLGHVCTCAVPRALLLMVGCRPRHRVTYTQFITDLHLQSLPIDSYGRVQLHPQAPPRYLDFVHSNLLMVMINN